MLKNVRKQFRIKDDIPLDAKAEVIYIHNGKAGFSPAYEFSEEGAVRVRLSRHLGVDSVRLCIYDEYSSKRLSTIDGSLADTSYGFDVFEIPLPLSKINVGIYYFYIEISSIFDIIYMCRNSEGIFFSREAKRDSFRLSVSDFVFTAPENKYGGIIYHIFVDRFFKKDPGQLLDGGYYVSDWYSDITEFPEYPGQPIKNNSFYGGTLWGICEKLEYISSLGVTLIYLSPIFSSVSNHKYDTADYMKVDEGFGGECALLALIEKARKYNIGIILDGVFNHTGADSIYFNKNERYVTKGAFQSKSSEYYSWYEFKTYPGEYKSWWGIDILPRINTENEKCASYFVGAGGVVEKYALAGISGFRLDVVDELSDEFISRIKSTLAKCREDNILYGEVWEDGSDKIAYGKRKHYYLGRELDGVMNYPLRRGLIAFLRGGEISSLKYALTDIIYNAPKRIRDLQMNLIGSHDTERIITALGGIDPQGKSNEALSHLRMSASEYKTAKRRLFMAYTVAATLPGIPSVYYADEVGLEGYSDPFCRRGYPWGKEDKEILSFFRKIGRIRTENTVYQRGEYKLLYLDRGVLIFARYELNTAYITVVNNRDRDLGILFSVQGVDLLNGNKSERITVTSYSQSIIKTSDNNFIKLYF